VIDGISNKLEVFEEALDLGFIEQKTDGTYRINPTARIKRSLAFDDVSIVQVKSVSKSRLDVDVSSEFVRGIKLDIPLVASNMSSVTNGSFALKLSKAGALGVLHRAWPETQQYLNDMGPLLFSSDKPHLVAASVGVGQSQLELAKTLIRHGASIIVIDIAHGFSDEVKILAEKIKIFSPSTKVVVGNTNNLEMLYEFNDCADAIKVGLSNGLACTTKFTAGVSENQFSTVLKFKEEATRLGMPIISDGGIREPMDFVKAMAAGASSVMAGSIFARCPNSAAKLVNNEKEYFGMASELAQERWKGGLKPGTCAEGTVKYLPIGQSVEDLLERYSGALKSGMTYAGASNIKELHKKVKFVGV
jgi:IMP dehydrogenase/GMP reductase